MHTAVSVLSLSMFVASGLSTFDFKGQTGAHTRFWFMISRGIPCPQLSVHKSRCKSSSIKWRGLLGDTNDSAGVNGDKHMYVHMHTCKYVCGHARTYTCTMYACPHAHTSTCTHLHTHVHVHTHPQCMHAHMHMFSFTHTHECTRARSQTHVDLHYLRHSADIHTCLHAPHPRTGSHPHAHVLPSILKHT